MNYQLLRDGQSFGPYTLDDLRRYLASGNVLPDDLVKSEEMTDWMTVTQVLGPMVTGSAFQTGFGNQGFGVLAEESVPVRDLYPFFPVSPLKFSLMSLATFGMYVVYWGYKQWVRIKRDSGESMMPWARALFSGLWNFSLFRRIHEAAVTQGAHADWNAAILASITLVLGVLSRLPDPYSAIVYLVFVSYLPVIATIEKINAQYSDVAESRNNEFSGINIVGLILGGVLFLLALAGLFLTKHRP